MSRSFLPSPLKPAYSASLMSSFFFFLKLSKRKRRDPVSNYICTTFELNAKPLHRPHQEIKHHSASVDVPGNSQIMNKRH